MELKYTMLFEDFVQTLNEAKLRKIKIRSTKVTNALLLVGKYVTSEKLESAKYIIDSGRKDDMNVDLNDFIETIKDNSRLFKVIENKNGDVIVGLTDEGIKFAMKIRYFSQPINDSKRKISKIETDLSRALGTRVIHIDTQYVNDEQKKTFKILKLSNNNILKIVITDNDSTFQFYNDSTPIPIQKLHTKKEASDMMKVFNPYPLNIKELNKSVTKWITKWLSDDMDFDEVIKEMK